MDVRSIPLSSLLFGHECEVIPINARKTGRDTDIDSLASSILAHGLGQALNVREYDGLFYVIDGNRRLAAIQHLAKQGKVPDDWPVPCNTDSKGWADEVSLALNMQRVAMHPADEYEKLHELHRRGHAPDAIAARFGIDPARVRRMLAIGALHPVILEAWRNDEFHNAVDVVRTFTLAPDLDQQEAVYKRLSKAGQLHPHNIRAAFGAGNREANKLLTFVGREAYLAAGGRITEDLFGDDHAISDLNLLQKLSEERLEREREQLVKDGWEWSELSEEMPNNWSYTWQKAAPKKGGTPTDEETTEIAKLTKLAGKKPFWDKTEEQRAAYRKIERLEATIKVRGYTAQEKAKAGAVVSIDHEGNLVVVFGVSKPAPVKAEKKANDAPAGISDALMARVSAQLTWAAQDAIAVNPKTALAAVVAGLMAPSYGGVPIKVKAEGLFKKAPDQDGFSAVFERLQKLSTEELLVALAHEAGFTVDLHSYNSKGPPLGVGVNNTLLDAFEQDALQEALRNRFDAEDYFKTVPKALALAAIAEAVNADEARKAEKLKKGELVKLAVECVPKTGWLPPELRTSTYAGPSAKKAQKPAKQKKAA